MKRAGIRLFQGAQTQNKFCFCTRVTRFTRDLSPWHTSRRGIVQEMPPVTPSFDPGLTQQYTGPLLRAINKDGSFNVRRRGLQGFAGSVYMHLVNLSWPRFWGLVALAFLTVNVVFASIYTLLGPRALRAAEADMGLGEFSKAFFFSVHTLTTVGYGDLYPLGL